MIVAPGNPASDPLVVAFLGESAGVGGPFALLGLPHSVSDAAVVREAAWSRIARIDRHALRLTPEADQVRLAVHASAAQLSDPNLRAELARHWPAGAPEHTPAAWRTSLAVVSDALARQARQVVGASGGWNARAKRRLALIARTHRVSAVDLVRAVRPEGITHVRSRLERVRSQADIPEVRLSGRFWPAVHVSLLVLLAAMVTLTTIELFPARDGQPGIASTPQAPKPAPTPVPGARAVIRHPDALEQELRNTALIPIEKTDEAWHRGERALDEFLSNWPEASSQGRERIAGLFRELLARPITQEGMKNPMVALLLEAATDSDPVRGAGAVGLVSTFRSDSGLSSGVRDRLKAIPDPAENADSLDARFVEALDARRPEDADDAPWWGRWSDALAAAGGASDTRRVEVRLLAFDALLRAESKAGPSWRATASVLAGGLEWRVGDSAPGWILNRLEDSSINPARLAVLTEVIATEVSAPGVDATMVLPRNPTPEDRAALAAAYRKTWLTGAAAPGPVAAAVIEALHSVLGFVPADSGPVEVAGGVERAAAANAAAALLYAGDEIAASELLAMSPPSPPRPAADPARDLLDDKWGARLLSAQPDQVAGVLAEATGVTACTPLAAEAMLETALRGHNGEMRDQARAMIVARGGSTEVLLALEREAADRPSSVLDQIISLVTGRDLPPTRDDAWAEKARAVLLIAAAEQAVAKPGEGIVLVEMLLAETAARRVGLSAQTPLATSTAREIERWIGLIDLAQADPLSAASVHARYFARLGLATGPIQLSAVRSRALVEAIAGALISRDALTRTEAERALAGLDTAWTNAPSAAHQKLGAEQAQAELWASLFGAVP